MSLGCRPGSHDTMTYCLNKKSPISPNESRLLQLLAKILPCVTLPVVLRWSITQVRLCGHLASLDASSCQRHPQGLTSLSLVGT